MTENTNTVFLKAKEQLEQRCLMALKEEQSRELNEAFGCDVGMFRVRTANRCLSDASSAPVPRNLYESLLYEGEITLLFADTGVGKSLFAVQIAEHISRTDRVLYIDLELSDKQFEKRYSQNYTNHYRFNKNFYRVDYQPYMSLALEAIEYDKLFIMSLRQMIEQFDVNVIIIDNMTKLITSDTDSARAAKPMMDKLCELKFEYGLTMLLLEHTRKKELLTPLSLNDLQGSKMKTNFADSVFCIGRSAKGKNLRYVKQLKCRSTEIVYDEDNVAVFEIVKDGSFLRFNYLEDGRETDHLYTTDNNVVVDNVDQRIDELLEQGIPKREIARRLGCSEGKVRFRLKRRGITA